MTNDDLIALLIGALGITRDDLLYALLTMAGLAPVVSWLRPRVDPALLRLRDKAAKTRTNADDIAVKIAATVWGFVAWLPATFLKLIPVFATADEVHDLQQRRRAAKLLEERK